MADLETQASQDRIVTPNIVNVATVPLSDAHRKMLIEKRSALQETLFENQEETPEDKIAMEEIKKITLDLGEKRYLS